MQKVVAYFLYFLHLYSTYWLLYWGASQIIAHFSHCQRGL